MATGLSQRLQGTGFVMLAEVPNEELLMGIVGRFWRLDGGRFLDLTVGDFVGFARPAIFAKARREILLVINCSCGVHGSVSNSS